MCCTLPGRGLLFALTLQIRDSVAKINKKRKFQTDATAHAGKAAAGLNFVGCYNCKNHVFILDEARLEYDRDCDDEGGKFWNGTIEQASRMSLCCGCGIAVCADCYESVGVSEYFDGDLTYANYFCATCAEEASSDYDDGMRGAMDY